METGGLLRCWTEMVRWLVEDLAVYCILVTALTVRYGEVGMAAPRFGLFGLVLEIGTSPGHLFDGYARLSSLIYIQIAG